MSDSIKYGGVTLDCPQAGELAAFYAAITGGEVTVAGASWAMVTCPGGSDICFQSAPGYVPPRWPDPASPLQMHLDFDVDDLDATEGGCWPPVPPSTTSSPTTTAGSTPIRPATPFCLSTLATADLGLR